VTEQICAEKKIRFIFVDILFLKARKGIRNGEIEKIRQ